MKPMDTSLKDEIEAVIRRESIMHSAIQQLELYEKIMELNRAQVVSPGSFNACAGLLEQLKFCTRNAFMTDGQNVVNAMNGVLDGGLTPEFR